MGGRKKKEWMGCFLDDLRAFGINADQWTTAAQDEGEQRRTAEEGAGYFRAKWIVAEKARAGPRHAVVCPNVAGRTKESVQLGQSLKTVGYGCTSCWGDVGAGDAEADVIYLTFIVSVQHLV